MLSRLYQGANFVSKIQGKCQLRQKFNLLLTNWTRNSIRLSKKQERDWTWARELLSQCPSNAILTQYFAYFNTALIFVETSRGQIQIAVETLSPTDVPDKVIQNAGQDLGTLLGRVLEVKLRVRRLIDRLEE